VQNRNYCSIDKEKEYEGKRLGRPPPAELKQRIRAALAKPGRPGVRKIAEHFGILVEP